MSTSTKGFLDFVTKEKGKPKTNGEKQIKVVFKAQCCSAYSKNCVHFIFLVNFFLTLFSLFFHFRFEIIMHYAKHNFIALFLKFSGLAQLQMSTIFNGRLPFENISTQCTLFKLQGHNIFTTNTL